MITDLPEHKTTEFWVRTASDKKAVEQGCYFDWDAADRVRQFAHRFIVHATGEWAGQPFELTPWQWFDVVAPLYGWKNKDGTRRFTRFGIAIPKKNGKSTLVAVLVLYALLADREPNAEVYLCSSNKQQAKIVFREAHKFIEASSLLKELVRPMNWAGRMELIDGDMSFLQILAADAKGKHGFNSHFTLFDEFHEQRTPELWNTMRYAGDARKQSMIGWISTAGFDESRPWVAEWDYARAVIAGKIIDVTYHAVVYEAQETDDYTDEEVWKKANPSLGITITLEKMRADFQEAQNKGLTTLRDWRILKLNQRVKTGGIYIPQASWDACAVAGTTVEQGNCFAGLDLASTRDLNALALVSWNGPILHVENYFWAPETVSHKEMANKEMYARWTEMGLLRRIPGDYIDHDRLADEIIGILRQKYPRKIMIDPHNASRTVTLLKQAGFIVETFAQNFQNYNVATRTLEQLVHQRRVAHTGNEVMSYCVSNCTAVTDRFGHMMPERAPNRLRKIDGVPATLMGLAEAIDLAPGSNKDFESW